MLVIKTGYSCSLSLLKGWLVLSQPPVIFCRWPVVVCIGIWCTYGGFIPLRKTSKIFKLMFLCPYRAERVWNSVIFFFCFAHCGPLGTFTRSDSPEYYYHWEWKINILSLKKKRSLGISYSSLNEKKIKKFGFRYTFNCWRTSSNVTGCPSLCHCSRIAWPPYKCGQTYKSFCQI